MDLLVKAKAHEQTLYGSRCIPPKLCEVKQVCREVAVSVSSSSGVTRTASQCQKHCATAFLY